MLLHGSIGSVYAFSLFVKPISEHIGKSQGQVQFAFSLAIFFLGMSAAFCGELVEKNIHKSSLISMLCFCGGLILTGWAMNLKSLILLYIGYGITMGVGLGLGYLSPVKTLMLWFKDNKGLATGISVCAFGFASSLASPLITYLTNHYSLERTFITLANIYLFPMFIAHWLLKKPEGWVEPQTKSDFKSLTMFKDKTFVFIWLMFFINITCGLAVISTASPMLTELHYKPERIALVVSVMGIFNGVGRLAFSAISDYLRKRIYIYYAIFGISIVTALCAGFIHATTFIALILISWCYGAGFSCLPTLLSDRYGMKNISKIHGLTLSAWAMAGLCGNQLAVFVQKSTGKYVWVFFVTTILYTIAMAFAMNVRSERKN